MAVRVRAAKPRSGPGLGKMMNPVTKSPDRRHSVSSGVIILRIPLKFCHSFVISAIVVTALGTHQPQRVQSLKHTISTHFDYLNI